jgi:signal transduction histidine kinase
MATNMALKPSPKKMNDNKFKLVRYFTVASVSMFMLVASALSFFQTQQGDFFSEVQSQQIDTIEQVQTSFSRQQQEISRRDLLAIQESGNVNLTRLFANSLWTEYMAPFVAQAAMIPAGHCDRLPDVERDGVIKVANKKTDCYAEVGARIQQLEGFKEVNRKVFDSMSRSTVFKIKVFDLRGITVYSSEHSQIGESKIDNKGWQSAIAGIPVSELTHRDTFSAFEGVVEDRDVISSYLPVYKPGSDRLVGVFEVYSDVTRFLNQIKRTSENIESIAQRNLAKVVNEAESNETRVRDSSTITLAIILALLLGLFVALYFIVLRADGIIKAQSEEREKNQRQLAQSEKMASLGQMVAGVAHQLNTPIAFSHSNITMIRASIQEYKPIRKMYKSMADYFSKNDKPHITLKIRDRKKLIRRASNLTDIDFLESMLNDTIDGLEQMQELVVNLQAFTRLDRSKTSRFDINKGLKNVVYIAKSVIPTGTKVIEKYSELPPVHCNPSQINQVFLNLINNAAHALNGSGEIIVSSQRDGNYVDIKVEDSGVGIAPDVLPLIFDMYFTTKPEGEGTGMGLGIARTITQEHGGDISVDSVLGEGTIVTVTLPIDRS